MLLAGLVPCGFWGLRDATTSASGNSDRIGAGVLVDSWFLAEAPSRRDLPTGFHRIVVRAPGYEQEERTVTAGSEPVLVQGELRLRTPPWLAEGKQ